MGKFLDLTGQRFGRLTVISFSHKNKRGVVYWSCKCDCGKETVASRSDLRGGNTQSCGCYRLQRIKETNSTHQESHTRLFKTWCSMRERCTYPRNNHYHIYGGRGIKVCDEWQEFIPFRDWALANGYRDDLTIDRIDPDGNYCPENCRWTDAKTQANNKRNNRLIEYKGQTKTLAQWCRDFPGLSAGTIKSRIYLYGWSVERAFETPVKRK